jgi:hypothetical protein
MIVLRIIMRLYLTTIRQPLRSTKLPWVAIFHCTPLPAGSRGRGKSRVNGHYEMSHFPRAVTFEVSQELENLLTTLVEWAAPASSAEIFLFGIRPQPPRQAVSPPACQRRPAGLSDSRRSISQENRHHALSCIATFRLTSLAPLTLQALNKKRPQLGRLG